MAGTDSDRDPPAGEARHAEIIRRLEEAADVLKRLPRPKELLYLKGKWSSWPAVIHVAGEAYGYGTPTAARIPPNADQIDRMDEAILWLLWLEKREGELVWLRCSGIAWRDLEYVFRRSSRTLQRRFRTAITEIRRELDQAAGPAGARGKDFFPGRSKKRLSQMS